MKKLLILVVVFVMAISVRAQLSPVLWSFSAKKTGDKTYEIHMKATIQANWHLYSQTQPDDAIATPTTFTINANPLFSLDGKIKEVGKMEVMKEGDISANQYSSSVDFVQKVKLKANVKTNFTGNVEFQTCDDKKCLPPKKTNFNITIL